MCSLNAASSVLRLAVDLGRMWGARRRFGAASRVLHRQVTSDFPRAVTRHPADAAVGYASGHACPTEHHRGPQGR